MLVSLLVWIWMELSQIPRTHHSVLSFINLYHQPSLTAMWKVKILAATRNILLLLLAAPVDKISGVSSASNQKGLDLGTTSFFFLKDKSYFEHYFSYGKHSCLQYAHWWSNLSIRGCVRLITVIWRWRKIRTHCFHAVPLNYCGTFLRLGDLTTIIIVWE